MGRRRVVGSFAQFDVEWGWRSCLASTRKVKIGDGWVTLADALLPFFFHEEEDVP
jgi:hypothetical protein